MLLYFEPGIKSNEWPMVVESLKMLYPDVKWIGGASIERYNPFWLNEPNGYAGNIDLNATPITAIIINEKYGDGIPRLSYSKNENKESLESMVKSSKEIIDGWGYLGLGGMDFDSVFDKLSESIRRIIKEEINEFDWVDVDDSGDTLYSVIKHLLEKQGGKYWMENNDGAIKLWDDTGYYFSIDEPDFTIEAIRELLHNSISNINLGDEIHEEYLELVKVLEPIIGPFVDERMEDLNESEEYDWIDTNPSNLSGQRLYDMMTELFKIQNDIYWIENTDLGTVEIWDSTGYYLEYNPEDFTIDRVREDLSINIDNYNLDPYTRLEYSNLAKALEPVIGPINSKFI